MNKKTYRKSLALLLVAALVVTSFPSYVFGYANPEDATQPVVATEETPVDSIEAESGIKYDPDYDGIVQIEDELTSKRGEFEKHFVKSDGTAVAVSYPQKVHYQVDGDWTDIDSQLVLKDKDKDIYGPKSSDLQVSLPGTATADILVPASGDAKASVLDISPSYLTKITDGDYSISWNILGNSKDYTSDFLTKAKTDTLADSQIPKAALAVEAQPDISKLSSDEQMTALPNLFSTATYKNVIKNVDVAVTVTPDKLKENLIINSPKGFTSVSYLMDAGNLVGKIAEDNSVIFTNDKDEAVFTIPTPLMLDSNTMPEESFDIGISLEKTTEGYILTLTPDSKWMNDPARVYPVILDPTVKTTQSAANIMETYIHSGDTAGEHYTSSYIRIGDTDIAICRGYVDFATRPSINTDLNDIVGGDFIGYLVSGTSTYHSMTIYQPTTSWSASTITWANRPSNSSAIASKQGVDTGTYIKYTFPVDASVKNWYSTGVQNGYMIKYTDETINDYNWFYSSDHPTISTSYYTYLAIEYAPDTLDPTISSFTVSPSTSSSAYTTDSTPTLTWSANDLHFKEIQYAVGSGAYTKISTSKTGSYSLPTGKVVSGTNALKLRAVDDSGNYSTVSTVNYYFDNTIPATLTVTPASSTNWVKGEVLLTATGTDAHSGINSNSYLFNAAASTLTPSNTYKVTTPGANSIAISVKDKVGNQKSITAHLVNIDNSSPVVGSVTAAKTDGTNIPLPAVTTVTNPTIKLVDITDTYSGLNAASTKYAIRAVGSTATLNYQLLPSPTVSTLAGKTTITSTLSLAGYLDGAYNIYFKTVDNVVNEKETVITYTLDTTTPVLGTVAVAPVTTPSTPTTTTNPTITVSGITDDINFLKTAYSINDGLTYTDMVLDGPDGKSGSYTLPANSITSEGVHHIKVKVIDKAGNFVISPDNLYYMDDPIVLTNGEYLGTVSLVNYYGKNLIHWNPPATIPAQVYYKVYRGATADFTMDSSTLLAEDLKTSYFVDMSIGGEGTYYYKVKVIKKNLYGDEVASDVVSGTMSGTQKTTSEFGAGIGQNFYMDYFTVSTPSGNGYVEKRYGNLGYSQQDFTLSNMEFDYGLTRTYNSQSANVGMLGKGWSDSYHQEIYKTSDGKYYYRQGDGTAYTFTLDSGSTYKCEQTKEYSLTVNSVPDEGVMYDIHTKDNTVYDFNVYGQVIKVSKPTGVGLKYEYDSYGRLTNVISLNALDQPEKTLGMTYSQTSPYTLSKIVLPDLSERLYGVSAGGKLDAVIYSHGGFTGGGTTESVVFSYGYDTSTGLLNLIKDGEQNEYSVEYVYDTVAETYKATKITYPNSEYFQIGYTPDGNGNTINTVAKKLGNSEFYSEQAVLDNLTGKILARTDASGISTQYEYFTANDDPCDNTLLVKQATSQRFFETLAGGTVGFSSSPVVESVTASYNSSENVTTEQQELFAGSILLQSTITNYEYQGTGVNTNSPTEIAVAVKTSAESIATPESETDYVYNIQGQVVSETFNPYDTQGITTVSTDYSINDAEEYVTSENTYTADPVITPEDVPSQTSTTFVDLTDQTSQTVNTAGAVQTETAVVYDTMGRIISETEVSGQTTTHDYDYLGREISVTTVQDGLSKTVTNSYNKNNSLVSTADELDISTSYTFDSINRETSRMTVGGSLSGGNSATSYGYEYNLSLPDQLDASAIGISYTETTTENGLVRTKWMDGKGKLVKESSAGVISYYTYDQSGNRVLEYVTDDDGDFARASMTLYDRKGNTFAIIQNPEFDMTNGVIYKVNTDPQDPIVDSILTQTLYYENGKIKAQIDGKGIVTYYNYDAIDRVTSIIEDAAIDGFGNLQPGGIESSIAYIAYNDDYPNQYTTTTTCTDSAGVVSTQVVDAAGLTILTQTGTGTTGIIATNLSYDTQGRPVKEIYQDSSYKTYEYNDKGQLASVSTFTVDTQIPEDPIEQTRVDYNYNTDGQLIGEVDSKRNDLGVLTPYYYAFYEYDNLGRMTGAAALNQEIAPNESELASHETIYAYNAAGQVTEITYPLNAADEVKGLKYDYDSNGRINYVKAVIGTTDKNLREYTYNDFGQVSAIKDYADFTGSGDTQINRTYSYDSFGRVISMQYVQGSTTLESFNLTYDANSNITSEVDGITTKSYSYDDLGNLTNVETSAGTTTYTYDNAGNRLTKETSTTRNNYDYNGLNQLTSMVEEEKDANGDFQPVASTAYIYDSKGNLTQDSETRGSVNTVVDNTYTVDSMLAGTNIQADSQTTLAQANTYNGNGQRITKDENGNLTNYFYQGSNVLYTTDSADAKTSQNFLSPVGSVINTARYAPTDISYYLYNKDIRNSTVSIVDDTAGIATKYSYDEFGITTVDGSYTFANEICYTGGIYDWASGQYYLNARFYDPQLGRFLSEDTCRGEVTDPNSWHLYAYCSNDPINRSDGDGKSWISVLRNAIIDHNAAFGAFFLMMKKDSNGIYHASFNCWQAWGGYNDFYDRVFDAVSSMKARKFPFSYNRTAYILWAWKGDYLNLGAGAELGIYYGGEPHWRVDKNLAMNMSMTLKYKGRTIISYRAFTWWITGFSPRYQYVKEYDLTATFTTTFKSTGMYNAFMRLYRGKGWKSIGGLSVTYTF